MELPERKKRILKAIIDNYIDTAEPVGSKMIANAFSSPLSSATIRNEMSELEELGYLEKPHVSAGRVPSYAAYRLYVNELMDNYRVAQTELRQLHRELEEKMQRLDNIMITASRVVSEMTNHTAVSMVTRENRGHVKKIELIGVDGGSTYAVVLVTDNDVKNKLFKLYEPIEPSDAALLSTFVNDALQNDKLDALLCTLKQQLGEGAIYLLTQKIVEFVEEVRQANASSDVYVEGAARLLTNREYQDTDKARQLLDYLSDKGNISRFSQTNAPNVINIRIGPENGTTPMRDASFVFTSYDIDENTHGIIGVVAPTRMDYAKACARLTVFVENLPKITAIRGKNQEIRSVNGRDGKKTKQT